MKLDPNTNIPVVLNPYNPFLFVIKEKQKREKNTW